jgi:cold-inducible RNA-binding protein
MATKLFVGGLPFAVDDARLNEVFAPFGTIVSATVITDRDTGRSKGFGFVEFADEAGAQAAIEGMNGKDLDGRTINVSEARPREER